jgi:DNA modification methylase
MMMIMMMMMMMIYDDDYDDDDGSHIHLHIESPPTWHFKNTQPFRNSDAEQRQGCTELVLSCFFLNIHLCGIKTSQENGN